jgi:hypothetical protein
VRSGIHNSSWLDGPNPAEAFEAVKVKAQWAHADGSRPGRLLRLSGERSGEEATSEGAHEGLPVHH